MKKETKEKIEMILNSCKDWNRGFGLIVPLSIGKILKRAGLKEGDGFTISRKITTRGNKLWQDPNFWRV